MTASAFETSDLVQLKGNVTGVTRLSKKVKLLMFIGMIGLMGLILFAIFTIESANADDDAGRARAEADEAARKKKNEPASAAALFAGVGDGNAAANAPMFEIEPVTPSPTKVPSLGTAAAPVVLQPEPAAPVVLSPAELRAKELADRREDMLLKAKAATLETDGAGGAVPRGALASGQLPASAPFLSGLSNPGLGVGAIPVNAGVREQDDPNKQIRKESFLKESEGKSTEFYLKERKQDAFSPFELKMGWKIPAILIDGINSDLPGQTCAQVSENVYDSATGRHLLIPQGTKACGSYDSHVAVGQVRILMVWNRLIFDDGSSISLRGMPGADQAGYAGFDAEVNNHYFRIFGGAVLMSLVTAGAQLSQPAQQQGSNAAPTIGQAGAAALGQQLGQVGSAMIQRDMRIQPTLTQEPGYRFNIQVTRDIVFPGPYGKRRG